MAKRWIHGCINTHCCGLFAEDDPHCLHDLTLIPKPTRKTILPSRLIQLNAFDPSCLDARLVDVKNSYFGNFCPPYAALTYCWGDDMLEHSHRTVGSNLAHRMQRIKYSQLPRTIQDSFTIARKLGVDYLWVDALCIVQDSNPDWHGESAKMGSIYKAAIFTIAADGSRDNDAGIFNEESIQQDESLDDGIVVVRNTLSNGQQSTLRFWIKPWMFYTHDGHQEPEIINQSQTSQRGWCCQERMLSTRILHFTETQLFWECQHQYQSEDGFVTWNPGQDTVAGILPQIPGPMYDVNGGGHASACELKWYHCIIQNDFSKREVRCPGERLIALSGIATMLSAKMGRPYLAGMWYGNTLIWALSWERASHTPARILVGAPSFSWASVNVRVRWLSRLVDFNPDSHLKLNNYKVRPSTQNKFGTVNKCYINVTGLLKEASIQKPSALREQQYTSRGSLRSLDRSLVGSAVMDHRQNSLSERVTCLLLGRSLSPETGYTWHVLLLKPKEGILDGYTRVGAGEIPMGVISSFPRWFSDVSLSTIYIH
jgi:Heterokaryon incompatibility protein (HET)